MRPRGNSGFTLIELVVVIAIIGILLTIAIPAYNSQLRHSRRSDALTALGALSLLQESYRAVNPTYGATLAAINGTGPGTLTHYNVTIAFVGGTNDGTNYILTATAKGGDDQNNDRSDGSGCATLVLTVVTNTRTKSPTSCWK